MAIQGKLDLMQSIEARLADVLTANDMARTMAIIKDELGGYAVEALAGDGVIDSDLMEAYLSAKAIEGRSAKTLERYRYVLTRAFQEMKVSERKATVYHLRGFLMSERKRGVSDSTLEGTRSIFSAYFNWLQREALITQNPCVNLGPIRCQKVVRLPFSDVEIERLKEACGEIRDKAIVCFLLSTGCRISEVVALNRTDVDMQGMQCKVLGKGNKERVVFIDNVTRMNLRRYELARSDDSPALFAGSGSARLTPGGVRKMLKSLEAISGVENVHPHRFRRTLATNLINRGMPIQEVARVLGHDKLDTTMDYVYLDDANVREAYRRYS